MRHLLPATFLIALMLLTLGVQGQQGTEITVYPALAADRTVSMSATRGKAVAELGVKKLVAKGTVALYSGSTSAQGHKLLVTDLTSDVATNVDEVDVDSFLALSTLGHLFVIPDSTASISATGSELLAQLEGKIVTEKTDSVGVYFVKKSDRQVGALLAQINAGGPFDETVATFATKDQKKIDGPELVPSVVAKLKNPKVEGEDKKKDEASTLLVSVSPDTMGAAPGLAAGGSSSGLAVFMELLRVFNKIYATGGGIKNLNLIFLLGRQGRLSYPGTADWLEHQDNNLLDNLDFSLCLDEVAGDKMFVHTTKAGSKDADLKAAFESLVSAVGDNSQHISKKINASHHEMRWEHEVFSYRNVNSATVSSSKVQRLQLARSSLIAEAQSTKTEKQLVQLTANLANWILSRGGSDKKVTAGDVNVAHLASWLEAGSKVARPSGVTGSAEATGIRASSSDFLGVGVKDAMGKLVDKAVGTVSNNYKKGAKGIDRSGGAKKDLGVIFYGPLSVQMTLHTTKSTAFEASVLVGALGYLFAIAIVLFGPGKAFALLGLN